MRASEQGCRLNQGVGTHPAAWLRIARRLSAAIAVPVVLAVLFSPLHALAIGNPDSMEFVDVRVYRNLYEDGDMLVVCHYNLAYASTPTETIDDAFLWRLRNAANTADLGSGTAYPFADNGYGHGVVSLYFGADDAPAWGGAYILRITGNPAYFATPPVYDFTLSASDYYSGTSQEDNQEALATWILDVAMDLEVAWAATLLDLTDEGVCLGATGESYFIYAIQGLKVLAPTVFYSYTVNPSYTRRNWTSNLSANYTQRFNGTWVQDSLDDLTDLTGTNNNTYGPGIIVMGACVGALVVSSKYFQTTFPGWIASAGLILMGGVLGWVSGELLGVLILLMAAWLGFIFLWDRSS